MGCIVGSISWLRRFLEKAEQKVSRSIIGSPERFANASVSCYRLDGRYRVTSWNGYCGTPAPASIASSVYEAGSGEEMLSQERSTVPASLSGTLQDLLSPSTSTRVDRVLARLPVRRPTVGFRQLIAVRRSDDVLGQSLQAAVFSPTPNSVP
ncbi:hypothetical protein BAUCODRAFT_246234 [Baudoinia panamericana UAMH 10762]|uniref:Uncharacterized protein n=1 Tax=Baudoinia panamericana (strain UAMH 10762) TaxID=717646 RepID=M2N4G3_BAUPA|nr:uncharacterized protein BAUCODRAFT_246234 [Baudoinia panamericana UAMH 10762]EMC93595.1 hypothetical protein BAUCODRAFT_246234 [Baudoinia panamericana UAMH 10762]